MLIPFNGLSPLLSTRAYVNSTARVIGDVHLGTDSSVWFHAVIRGDVNPIRIGARSNVQDNATIHVTTKRWATIVGDDVTIGHAAVLHGCTVGNRCLIGIGAIVMDGCEIGDDCVVGAGALLTPGTVIPPGHLAVGSPGKAARPLRPEEISYLAQSAANYVALAATFVGQGIT